MATAASAATLLSRLINEAKDELRQKMSSGIIHSMQDSAARKIQARRSRRSLSDRTLLPTLTPNLT